MFFAFWRVLCSSEFVFFSVRFFAALATCPSAPLSDAAVMPAHDAVDTPHHRHANKTHHLPPHAKLPHSAHTSADPAVSGHWHFPPLAEELGLLLLKDEETQVNGAIILENLDNYPIFALNSMKGMGPSGMRASFDWLGAAPLRLRGLYACKQPWYVGFMLALVKPFMSRKLRERTNLYGADTAKMLAEAGLKAEHVPPAYGGTMEGFDPAWFLSERT